MFPKSTISFKRQNANGAARRKIADACSTAAIVAELLPATKMGGQMDGQFASGMFLPAEPPCGHLSDLFGPRDTLGKDGRQ